MRIALCQLNPIVGDPVGNVRLMLEAAHTARAQDSELAIFPELVISGYPPLDLLERDSFINACLDAEQTLIQELPENLTAVFGNLWRRTTPKSGLPLENVAVIAQKNMLKGRVAKTLLPTYDVFDEARYFEPCRATEPFTFNIGTHKIGVTVCEDIWDTPKSHDFDDITHQKMAFRNYGINPVEPLVKAGANIILNISASPWSQYNQSVREQIVCDIAKRYQVHIAYVNAVGANDGLVFDGHSLVATAGGQLVARSEGWRASVSVIDLEDPKDDSLHSIGTPSTERMEALTLGVSDYFKKTGVSRAIVGLSGGIDSAVTCAIAVRALGSSNVIGVGMPSNFSSSHSIEDARELAHNLGIQFHLIPIESSVQVIEEALAPVFESRPRDLTEENLQSRTRGLILMAIANKFGAVVLGTGNKSEAAMGYATLYGDTIGALSVLADLYKNQVYEMADTLNQEKMVIPRRTIEKPPSAELRPDQKDTDSLPPYEVLDAVLERFIERRMHVENIASDLKINPSLVQSIVDTVYRNEFKRKQLPPTIRTCQKAWVGRVYPIAQRFRA